MTNRELLDETKKLVLSERKVTFEILKRINEVREKRAYVEAGFSTPFAWLTKGLGYSEAAASRRLKSADLLSTVPEVGEKIKTGALNLSNLAQAQSVIRSEEKRTGVTIDRREVLEQIESCTQHEAEKKLAELFPEAPPKQDTVRCIDSTFVRAQITFTHEQMRKIDRLKEVLSHAKPAATMADIVEAAVDALLKQKDPLEREMRPRVKRRVKPRERKSSAAEAERVTPAIRNLVFRKAGAMCEHVDPLTGKRCGSSHFLEIDHIIPRAKNGTNDPGNLRAYCRTHNLHAAEQIFGEGHMRQFRGR